MHNVSTPLLASFQRHLSPEHAASSMHTRSKSTRHRRIHLAMSGMSCEMALCQQSLIALLWYAECRDRQFAIKAQNAHFFVPFQWQPPIMTYFEQAKHTSFPQTSIDICRVTESTTASGHGSTLQNYMVSCNPYSCKCSTHSDVSSVSLLARACSTTLPVMGLIAARTMEHGPFQAVDASDSYPNLDAVKHMQSNYA